MVYMYFFSYNQDGLLSQNVLAACSFDLEFFCYSLAGKEGSSTDLSVLKFSNH
jgi:hypothetical protein